MFKNPDKCIILWAGVATFYELDGPLIELKGGGGRDFPQPSRPALGLNQPSIQWVHAPPFESNFILVGFGNVSYARIYLCC
jgi:hypothetical protein